MTVFENVALPILQRAGRTSRIFGNEAPPHVAREVSEILEKLGLGAMARRRVADIAYGEQRLVELAMSLAMQPKVLLLDEPAAGAGSAEAGRILKAIQQLPADIAILLIDHDMDLVFRFATRVMVLAEGALIFEGPASAVTESEAVRKAYLGSYAHDRSIA